MKRRIALAIAIIAIQPLPAATIRLRPEVQQHLGLATQRLAPTRRAGEIDAFAKVLDPGPLAQLVSDLRTAQAASMASHAEALRANALHAAGGGVSARDSQTATALARADTLKVAFLRQRLGLEWGPGIAHMSDARRDRLVMALAHGAAALVHVDTHNNDGQAGARTVKIDIGATSARGVVIGPARVAEPRLQSSGLIVEVTGPSAILLSVGLTQSAHIESASLQDGVILPRDALIRFRGAAWAYVRNSGGFERRLVPNPVPEEKGFFVASGFAPGDEVVVRGVAGLFAAEKGSGAGARQP
ncbi:efflux RND transporter periplasmic adaptor subunit [Novosphingobium rosa]|uniref:hypothetical protein n=1 Tax=Novosphingobium rosa TaxID=76978 RepID=UPI00082A5E20|nr:hypothetical protein [Novosphingobium rosa]